MSRELHHRKIDDKYALWSTVIDDYVTGWKTKEEIRAEWIAEKVLRVVRETDEDMKRIDKEVG